MAEELGLSHGIGSPLRGDTQKAAQNISITKQKSSSKKQKQSQIAIPNS